jgi:hypothetical protein
VTPRKNDEIWETRFNEALNRHYAKLSELRGSLVRTETDLENTRERQRRIRIEIEEENKASKVELEKISSRRNDPVVYVRNYSKTTVNVYHRSLECGRRGWMFKEMLLGDAEDAGLRPCSSCGRATARPTAA